MQGMYEISFAAVWWLTKYLPGNFGIGYPLDNPFEPSVAAVPVRAAANHEPLGGPQEVRVLLSTQKPPKE